MKVYVFVYGSLKMGYENNYILENATFVSDAITCDKFQMYPVQSGEYPFLIKSEKAYPIMGEVYEINNQAILDCLDVLEGYPEFYTKEFINIKLEDGTIIQALTYFKNEETNLDCMDKTQPMREWF